MSQALIRKKRHVKSLQKLHIDKLTEPVQRQTTYVDEETMDVRTEPLSLLSLGANVTTGVGYTKRCNST